MSETTSTATCEHRWRVVAFERESQLVAYRCELCRLEKFERPDEGEEREARC